MLTMIIFIQRSTPARVARWIEIHLAHVDTETDDGVIKLVKSEGVL